MTAHTPGPWAIQDFEGEDVAIVGAGDYFIARVQFSDEELEDENQANARPIAAAPDLLAALKALLPEGWDDGVMDHMPGVFAARSAIAKAEGK